MPQIKKKKLLKGLLGQFGEVDISCYDVDYHWWYDRTRPNCINDVDEGWLYADYMSECNGCQYSCQTT